MPPKFSYPGIYTEEGPSGSHMISGVATSITAFIGRTLRGPVEEPVHIQNYAEYQRIFGGLWVKSPLSYAVQHFFWNGGVNAFIVRIAHKDASKASANIGGLDLVAANEGCWGNHLQAILDQSTANKDRPQSFNLTIQALTGTNPDKAKIVSSEIFRDLSTDPDSERYLPSVLMNESHLARVGAVISTTKLDKGKGFFTGGEDGSVCDYVDFEGDPDLKTGMYALDKGDSFNLLCIPPFERNKDVAISTWKKALELCKKRRAMLIIDPPSHPPPPIWRSPSDVMDVSNGLDSLQLRDDNAAIYYPNVKIADPLKGNRLQEFAPCGVVAGIYARTDSQRGVWKAPAGKETTMIGVQDLSYQITDEENGQLNQLGVNCIRKFPENGNIIWGARTLAGTDSLFPEIQYVPVRRTALYIEESIYRGTRWVVFEPNDEPLWAKIRLNVGAFMYNLFRQGAFQGTSPNNAYFVKCDTETTTQNDIDRGIANIVIGYAPLKPAEFVVIKISLIAGQIQ